MARQRLDLGVVGGARNDDLVTQIATLTTLITAATAAVTALVAARVAASETNATVTTDVTAVQTAITAVQTAVTAFSGGISSAMVVDIDLVKCPDLNTVKKHLAGVLMRAAEIGLK